MTNFLDGWDLDTKKRNNDGNEGGLKFTKFPEGITKIRLLNNVPHMRWSHWMPQFKRKLTCAGFGCPIDELDKRLRAEGQDNKYGSSRAFSFNIFNVNENRHELMEEGVTMIEELKASLIESVQAHPDVPVEKFIFKVRKRIGSSNKASWSVDLEGVVELNEFEQSVMSELVDRAEYFKPPTVEQVQALLEVADPDEAQRIAKYNHIMGFVRQEGEDDLSLGVEV